MNSILILLIWRYFEVWWLLPIKTSQIRNTAYQRGLLMTVKWQRIQKVAYTQFFLQQESPSTNSHMVFASYSLFMLKHGSQNPPHPFSIFQFLPPTFWFSPNPLVNSGYVWNYMNGDFLVRWARFLKALEENASEVCTWNWRKC